MVQNIKTTPLTLLDRFNQMTFATEVSRSRAEGKKHGRFAYIPVEKRVEKLHLPKLTLNMYTSVQKCNFPTMFHISD